MILTVDIENYQSIRDKVTLDLTVGKHAPNTNNFVPTPEADTRAVVTQALMGANASGKSTILKAIAAVQWIIVDSFREDLDKLPINRFAGDKKPDKPTRISVTFNLNNKIHIYEVSANTDMILKERLAVKNVTNKRMTTKQVFERTWDDNEKSYKVTDNNFKLTGHYWKSDELKNSSIIAAAQRLGNKYANQIVSYWHKVTTNIEVEDHFRPQQIEAYFAAKYYGSHPESRKDVEKDIRRYDLGIEGFGDDGLIKHKYNGGFFNLSIDQESSGTMQILLLHRKIERILEHGGVALIDEFDAFLHPLMTKEMIKKFTNPKINKGGGQLIFSSHDVSVMDCLSKYELHIVEKSKNGITSVKRVDSMPGIRTTRDLKKLYLDGNIGGLPDIKPPVVQ